MPCKQRSKYTSAELNGECLVARKEESNPYERNTGKVPEDDHETPFLVEHIPSLRDAFFALAARVEIEPGREDHERHVLHIYEYVSYQHLGRWQRVLTGVT